MNEPNLIQKDRGIIEEGNGGRRREERFKFRHVHAITGTFVLIVLGALIAVILLAGRSQRWFIGNVNLRIILPEGGAAGIREGSEVYFLGTLMGTVSDVSVDPTGRMEAEVNIRRDFFLFVRDDSSAVVKRKWGVMGDAYFEISRGRGKTLPEKNARIVCREQLPSALEAAVEEIRHEAVPALKKLADGLDTWTTLGSNLISSRERLDHLMIRAESVLADIQGGKGTAGKLIVETTLADEAQEFLSRANEAMSDLQSLILTLQTTATNLQKGTDRLPEITDAMAVEAKDLPGLVRQTQTSMRELERLIEAMQRHWLLRKYVNKTNPPPPNPAPATTGTKTKTTKSVRLPKSAPK